MRFVGCFRFCLGNLSSDFACILKNLYRQPSKIDLTALTNPPSSLEYDVLHDPLPSPDKQIQLIPYVACLHQLARKSTPLLYVHEPHYASCFVYGSAFDGVVLDNTIGPLTKLYSSLIIHLESNRNNHLKIIMLRITSHLTGTFGLNYPEIPDSCIFLKL